MGTLVSLQIMVLLEAFAALSARKTPLVSDSSLLRLLPLKLIVGSSDPALAGSCCVPDRA